MGRTLKDTDALILDLDGVITDTADQHFRAWKRLFDAFLHERDPEGESRPFTREDYLAHVDGKPRLEGASDFLESRGIRLPEGSSRNDPGDDTLRALGDRKNRYYHEILEEEGVEPFPDAVILLRRARDAGIPCAMVSSSRNARQVVEAAGLADFFRASVDGEELARLDLPGKPDPALFLEAADRLGVEPQRAAVLEDARAGVEAGRNGGFGTVVGVARNDDGEALKEAGADLVVSRLDELVLDGTGPEETDSASHTNGEKG